jgi:hypothetical protein
MERDGAGEASRHHSNKVGGFIVASLVAPMMTLVAMMGIGTISGPTPDFAMPINSAQFFGTLVTGVVILVGAALIFGLFGSAVLLGATFSVVAFAMRGRGRARLSRHMLAGVLAGGLHVGLACWSTHGWPPGPAALLGTWFLRDALEEGSFVLALAPLIGGAVAGLVYARVSSAQPGTR